MSQLSIAGSGPVQPLPAPARKAPPAAAAPAAAGPAPISDRLSTTSASSAAALPSLALVESPQLDRLRGQLAQAGSLVARLESLAPGLSWDAHQALDKLKPFLEQPAEMLETLAQLSEDDALAPAAQAYLGQIMQQLSEVLAAGQSGDATALQQALSAPLRVEGQSLPLHQGMQHLGHVIQLDQSLQRRDGRELLAKTVNGALDEGLSLLKSGKVTPAQLDEAVFSRLQSGLDQENKQLLAGLARGEVQGSIATLRERFSKNLQVPGFAEALKQALAGSGLPEDQLDKLGDSKVLGKMPIELLEKVTASLHAQLLALPPGSGELRRALSTTLSQDLPEVLKLRTGFQQFRVTMQHQVGELTQDLKLFCRKSGLELPARLIARLEQDPLVARKELMEWIDARRAGVEPDRAHTLDGLEQFALQLFSGADILASVEGGEQISPKQIEGYERFQVFILAKRALIEAFDKADSSNGREIKRAIIEFGARFAEWQGLSSGEMQQQIFAWLGKYVDQAAIQALGAQVDALRSGFESHNQRIDTARRNGVELGDEDRRQARADQPSVSEDQQQRLVALARRESEYYAYVDQTRGDAGLREVLKRDRELVLEPMARSLMALTAAFAGLEGKPLPSIELPEAVVAPTGAAPLPSAAGIDKRLKEAQSQARLAKEVDAIKRDLARNLRDASQQAQALAAAGRLRSQLQAQIFELHNRRLKEEERHRLESLEVIEQHLKRLLE